MVKICRWSSVWESSTASSAMACFFYSDVDDDVNDGDDDDVGERMT